MDKIKVSETFLSIQGEGAAVGTRCVFLRTSGCLCSCKWCDTEEVWKSGTEMSIPDLVALFEERGYIQQLDSGAHLVLTGGDPLMWQKPLARFISALNERLSQFFVEAETEAMIVPTELLNHVHLWNVSPKLSNACTKPLNDATIQYHAKMASAVNIFKFVVADEDDVKEAVEVCRKHIIRSNKAYLMPLASTREEYLEVAPRVVELALKYRFNFSPREQIAIWNQATGV